MRILDEVWDRYGFQLMNQQTFAEIQHYLNTTYPQADWKVKSNGDTGIRIIPQFRTPQEKTMYLLKWT
jgi:hypothetical protein